MHCKPIKINLITGGYAHNPSVLKNRGEHKFYLIKCALSRKCVALSNAWGQTKNLSGKKLQRNMPSNLFAFRFIFPMFFQCRDQNQGQCGIPDCPWSKQSQPYLTDDATQMRLCETKISKTWN
jgi:hypothetical protein